MGSSSRTRTETRSDTTNQQISTGQELSDNAVGLVGDGNQLTITRTDYGAVETGAYALLNAADMAAQSQQAAADAVAETLRTGNDTLQIAGDNIMEANEKALNFGSDALASNEAITADAMNFGRDALTSNENVTADALNFGRDSLSAVERLAEGSQIGAMDSTQKMKELSEYVTEQGINAALTGAGMGQDIAQEALLSNLDSTSNALEKNTQLASGFGELLTGFAADNQAVSEAQASQYAQNLLSMGQELSDVSGQSISAQNDLASEALQTMSDNSEMTQTALLSLAERQERGLDSALQVAGSVAMDDNAEAATNQTKYLALAIGAGAVALALRS